MHANDETPTPVHADETPTPLKMPASTEEERSRTLEIEEPSTPATPAPDVAERLKLAGNEFEGSRSRGARGVWAGGGRELAGCEAGVHGSGLNMIHS